MKHLETSIRSASFAALMLIALGVLLCVCLAGCRAMSMSDYGSTPQSSALWSKDAPAGGGAVLITGESDSSQWETYQFDADGRVVDSETFNPEGYTWRLSHYSYDDQGREIRQDAFEIWDDTESIYWFNTHTYEYGTDTVHTRTVRDSRSKPDSSSSTVTTYDENGYPISVCHGDEGAIAHHAEYKGTVPKGFVDDNVLASDPVLAACGIAEQQ